MKKNDLSIILPCLVMCALAFIDADYANLSTLNILAMGSAVVAVVAIALYFFKTKAGRQP